MIHIVTAFTRTPDFLDRAYESMKRFNFDYHWYIVTTSDKRLLIDDSKYKNTTVLVKPDAMPMHTGVNYYYDIVPDRNQWVYVLDDDNLMHPNFEYVSHHTKVEECDMIVMDQHLKNNQFRRLTNIFDITIQKIDNGQFILRRRAVGNLRYWPIYRGDGYFATEMRIVTYEAGRNIAVLPVVGCYYNAQTEIFK
jgi:hypothetical protein